MVRILVDTGADYNREEFKTNGIEHVSMSILIGDKPYKDTDELDKDEFYELLIQNEEFPKTSQPTPDDFLKVFKDVKEKGDEMVCIVISSAVSGTCQSAVLAKNMTDYKKIYIVDSLGVATGNRFLADTAKKMATEGKNGEEIAKALEELKNKVKIFAGVDTLEYLYKGGRLSKAAAAIGETVKIKPIVTISDEGTVEVFKKCIGKKQAIIQMKKMITDASIDANYPVYTIYTYGTENVEALEEKLQAEGINVDARYQIGASIGAHVGPEAFGICYVEKQKLMDDKE